MYALIRKIINENTRHKFTISVVIDDYMTFKGLKEFVDKNNYSNIVTIYDFPEFMNLLSRLEIPWRNKMIYKYILYLVYKTQKLPYTFKKLGIKCGCEDHKVERYKNLNVKYLEKFVEKPIILPMIE